MKQQSAFDINSRFRRRSLKAGMNDYDYLSMNRSTRLLEKCDIVDSAVYSMKRERRRTLDEVEQEKLRKSIDAGKALMVACRSDAPLEHILVILKEHPEAVEYEDEEGFTPIEVCRRKSCCCNYNRKKVIAALENCQEYYESLAHEKNSRASFGLIECTNDKLAGEVILSKVKERFAELKLQMQPLNGERQEMELNSINEEMVSLENLCLKKKLEIKSKEEKMQRRWPNIMLGRSYHSKNRSLSLAKMELLNMERDLEELRETYFMSHAKHIYSHYDKCD